MEFSRSAFEALQSVGMTRAWDGLGGSHTLVTYPPLDALTPLAAEPVLQSLAAAHAVNLYVHVPFCEMSCSFCPYETRLILDSDLSIRTYLNALAAEMDLIAENLRGAEVRSLYIGGGTATVLPETEIENLLKDLRKRFQFSPDALICIETSPNALIQNPSKIGLLKDLGVRRVSVGVQTFSETALQSEGRTHRPEETLAMLETLIGEVDDVNIDLMQDMCGQTDEDLARDADRVAALRPAQVTWYVERLRKRQGEFPDSYRSVARRLWLRDRMKALSYRPRPGGRFVRAGRDDDTFKGIRCGLTSHMVGLGASAYSHVPGYFYRNILNTGEYVQALSRRNSPVSTGARLRPVDVLAGSLASRIRWGVGLAQPDRSLDSYITEMKRRLEILVRHELVRLDPSTGQYQITLEGPGWAYEEEICSLFVPHDVIEQIRANHHPWWQPAPSTSSLQSTLAVLGLPQAVDVVSLLL
jgi:oxygen-independent coproporphyrinogen-3 oxidase